MSTAPLPRGVHRLLQRARLRRERRLRHVWGVTLSIVWVPILQQIWLGPHWILRCEMNMFWAGGICLRSYNEDYPFGLRDKL